jgi:hypothetical protein
MEATDLSNYDLSCFNLAGCDPDTFQELIQFIINKICALQASDTQRVTTIGGGCPDCVVSIAECFQYTNQFGDRVTTMQLTDYARAIGTKVCNIVSEIANINEILANHETRITTLENEPDPTIVLPQVTPSCVLPAIPSDMQAVITAVEQQFCQLRSSTGLPTQLFSAIAAQCVNLNASPTLGVSGSTMSSIPGWVVSVTNLADSINNLWLTICDLRSAISYIQLNCCPSGCDGVEINMTATFDGTTLRIYLTGTIPAGFADCDSSGNLFSISDTTGGSISQRINVTSNINSFTGTSIVLTGSVLNLGSDFTIHTDACINNASTGATCQFCIDYVLDNTTICPAITLTTTTDTTVDYSFNVTNPGTYTMQLWNADGTLVIAQNTTVVVIAGPVTGQFTGLTASTNYRVSLRITIGGVVTDCPFVPFTTNPVVCTAPTGVLGVVELPVECVDCGTALGFVSGVSPGDDAGWYVDDDANIVRYFDGAIFSDLLDYTVFSSSGTSSNFPESRVLAVINNPTSVYYGQVFVQVRGTAAGSATNIIEIYSGNVLQSTIASTNLVYSVGAGDAVDTILLGMCYDTSEDTIYYIHSTGALGYVGRIILSSLTYNKDVLVNGGTFDGNIVLGSGSRIDYNPYTNIKHVTFSTGAVGGAYFTFSTNPSVTEIVSYVGRAALNAVSGSASFTTTWAFSSRAPVFLPDGRTYVPGQANSVAGEAAILVLDNTGVYDSYIEIIDATPYALTSATMTYYPGDGTPNSDRILMYGTAAGVDDVLSMPVNGPYTVTLFYATGATSGFKSLFWSNVYQKLIQEKNGTMTVIDSSGNVVQSGVGASLGQISVYHDNFADYTIWLSGSNSNPGNNVLFLETNPLGTIVCTQDLVQMYSGDSGPYYWDSATSAWVSGITWGITDLGASINVTAIFGVPIQYAQLIYSTNGGVTWEGAGSFVTAADLAGPGVTYVKNSIANPFVVLLRLAVLTDDDCGIVSSPNYDYYPIS